MQNINITLFLNKTVLFFFLLETVVFEKVGKTKHFRKIWWFEDEPER